MISRLLLYIHRRRCTRGYCERCGVPVNRIDVRALYQQAADEALQRYWDECSVR